jgi:predicted RNA-binding Zn ribbon-like protein
MTGYILNPFSITPKNIFKGYTWIVGSSISKPFKLFAGHPALELVNTLDLRFSANPQDLLPSYGDLLSFAAQLRLMPLEQTRKLGRTVRENDGRRVLASAVELREALAAVLYAWGDGGKPADRQIEILEKHFHNAALHRSLRSGDERLVWSWSGFEQQAELPLWKLAQSASDLLVSEDAKQVKGCGDPTCRWLFLDLSKNHTRRWCDMKTCGNRMKARRYQARLQETSL